MTRARRAVTLVCAAATLGTATLGTATVGIARGDAGALRPKIEAAAHGAPAQTAHVWALSHLARADELLRHRRPKAAARLFMKVFERSQGTRWAGLAELGLAWTAVARGDLASAHFLSNDAIREAGFASDAANVLLALLKGGEGDSVNAVNRLTRILNSPRAGLVTRTAARLARGYVHFWAESYAQAAADFDAVAMSDSTGLLVDDGQYGAAWSRISGGDTASGTAALQRIVSGAPLDTKPQRVKRGLVDLEPGAILRDSFRRYRKAGVQMPDAQLARLLDSDGVSRARAALQRLDPDRELPVPQGLSVARVVSADTPTFAGDPWPVMAARRAPARHDLVERRKDATGLAGSVPRTHFGLVTISAVAALAAILLLAIAARIRVGHRRPQS